MIAIIVKSINTLTALHESDGKVGDTISIYSAIDGSLIEECVIFECESY
ncbi:hypothetical protein M0D70_00180 [Acinetobacter portensis]|uniref:Uncharacterized protein n=2 Tax=Acinetobacter TaxID=469 RepID=A0A6L6GBW5_9GAMM|nr:MULTISPECIES: hypothetical protein [Acinetobacter]MCK7607887.1 hypothetical protein [Acinetobacter portensis]MCK7638599.1 hypothetical protein [Acinetobacter portensis]MDY6458411.1 hypothetical protein [Acinetobacter faecalis]MDY6460656.1 hypothetical protein [Acinetobacter faecalis]MDY6484715.1 hypothetical protein [Acinetobacter faecalis]